MQKSGSVKRVSFKQDMGLDGAIIDEATLQKLEKAHSVLQPPGLLKRQSVDDGGSSLFRYS